MHYPRHMIAVMFPLLSSAMGCAGPQLPATAPVIVDSPTALPSPQSAPAPKEKPKEPISIPPISSNKEETHNDDNELDIPGCFARPGFLTCETKKQARERSERDHEAYLVKLDEQKKQIERYIEELNNRTPEEKKRDEDFWRDLKANFERREKEKKAAWENALKNNAQCMAVCMAINCKNRESDNCNSCPTTCAH